MEGTKKTAVISAEGSKRSVMTRIQIVSRIVPEKEKNQVNKSGGITLKASEPTVPAASWDTDTCLQGCQWLHTWLLL